MPQAAKSALPAAAAVGRAAKATAPLLQGAAAPAGGAPSWSLFSWVGAEAWNLADFLRTTLFRCAKALQAVANFFITVALAINRHRVSLFLELRRYLLQHRGEHWLPRGVARRLLSVQSSMQPHQAARAVGAAGGGGGGGGGGGAQQGVEEAMAAAAAEVAAAREGILEEEGEGESEEGGSGGEEEEGSEGGELLLGKSDSDDGAGRAELEEEEEGDGRSVVGSGVDDLSGVDVDGSAPGSEHEEEKEDGAAAESYVRCRVALSHAAGGQLTSASFGAAGDGDGAGGAAAVAVHVSVQGVRRRRRAADAADAAPWAVQHAPQQPHRAPAAANGGEGGRHGGGKPAKAAPLQRSSVSGVRGAAGGGTGARWPAPHGSGVAVHGASRLSGFGSGQVPPLPGRVAGGVLATHGSVAPALRVGGADARGGGGGSASLQRSNSSPCCFLGGEGAAEL